VANMTELVLPSAHPIQQPKWQIDRFSSFFKAHGIIPYSLLRIVFPQNCPFPWGSGPPSQTRFLRLIQAQKPNGISIGSAVFAQMIAEFPYTLQWDTLSPLKVPLKFPRPTQVLNPNGISIGSAVSAALTSVTDRLTKQQTDHVTRSVTTGCIYIRSTAMWPKSDVTVPA